MIGIIFLSPRFEAGKEYSFPTVITGEMEKSEVMIPVNVRAVHSQVKSRLKSPDFEAVAGKNRKKFGK